MSELKGLEGLGYPLIDSHLQQFCASRGIFTVQDFLIHDLNALLSSAEMQNTSHTLKQGIDQLLLVVHRLHTPWIDGVALLADAQHKKHTLSLMYQESDFFLHGALREGLVTELVGPSASGKTQVCLQAVASIAKGYRGGVVFVDTGNSFSATRVAALIDRASYSTSTKENHTGLDKIMMNVRCLHVYDIFSLLDVLHELELTLKSQMLTGQHSLRLLIVDSFSSVIVPVLGGNGPYGHAVMTSTGNFLKKIAHEYNVCILVTNHMVGGDCGSLKPALGESWKSIPHVRLLLSRDRERNTCSISVLKHPSKAAWSQVRFTI